MAVNLKRIRGVVPYASEHSLYQAGVLSFNIRGMAPEEVAERLSKQGIAVRAGLHCAPLAHSTVGTEGTVRVSVSAFTSRRDVDRFLNVSEDIAMQRLRSRV